MITFGATMIGSNSAARLRFGLAFTFYKSECIIFTISPTITHYQPSPEASFAMFFSSVWDEVPIPATKSTDFRKNSVYGNRKKVNCKISISTEDDLDGDLDGDFDGDGDDGGDDGGGVIRSSRFSYKFQHKNRITITLNIETKKNLKDRIPLKQSKLTPFENKTCLQDQKLCNQQSSITKM